MLSTKLLSQLQRRFPDRGLRTGTPPNACAVFPAVHRDVGNVEIYDDGDELTVAVGNFTHGHFSNYDENLSNDKKESEIVGAVLDFLEDLFADRVVLWGAHKRGSGWYYPTSVDEPPQYEDEYVWSGPRFREA